MVKEAEAATGEAGLIGMWQTLYQNGTKAFLDTQEEFGRACNAMVDEGAKLSSEGIKIARQSLEAGNAVYESMVKATSENVKRTADVMTKLWVNPCRRQMEQFNKILFGG
jgi:hypothetical protein